MTSKRKLNFNGGPAALPEEVLKEASEAVVDYNGTGLSILELPHRGKDFEKILEEAKELVRELCGLNSDYEILWLHGGGRLQFCMVPMNFLGPEDTAGYVASGHWAEEAMEYAAHYGDVEILSTSREDNYAHLPKWPTDVSSNLAYLHYTTNNTIYGTQFHTVPKSNVPLIADMSSDILCSKRDYTNCALIYAAAQKNIGPAGATMVAVRKDMLERIHRDIPAMLSYKKHAEKNSLLNTPPVFAIYTSMLTLRWTKKKGIAAIEEENKQKAALLYNEIDRNSIFTGTVTNKADRSMMNACFTANNTENEKAFLQYCSERDITGIKGHRFVGGFRASLYNAVSIQATEALVQAMQDFEKENKY